MKQLRFLLIVVLFAFMAWSCHTDKKIQTPESNSFISGFTQGMVMSRGEIVVVFSGPVKDAVAGKSVSPEVLMVEPSASGKRYWRDDRTLVFKPDNGLKRGSRYTITVFVDQLFSKVPKPQRQLSFDVVCMPQDFTIKVGDITIEKDENGMATYAADVTLEFADTEWPENIEKIISGLPRDLSVKWIHNASTKTSVCKILNIKRKDSEYTIKVPFDGSVAGVSRSGKEQIVVPSLKDFKVVSASYQRKPTEHVRVTFSDFLSTTQDLRGLVALQDNADARIDVHDNSVWIFPNRKLSGDLRLVLAKSIKNSEGYTLKDGDFSATIPCGDLKPDMRFIGKSVIVPKTAEGLIVPFEAVNLKAVDLYIIKIYEKNIPYLLHDYSLAGSPYEIAKLGKLVVKKRIDLEAETHKDQGEYHAYSFDLAGLISPEPGALYQLELRMKKSYSAYPGVSFVEDENETLDEREAKVFDVGGYWPIYDYDDNYSWRDREDPSKPSYYSNRSVTRNVLASDIGLVAKAGENGEWWISAQSILSAKPLDNTGIKIYDAQNMPITAGFTNTNGCVSLTVKQKPYLVVAEKGLERGYLKVDDGSALSVSQFDVQGDKVQKGLKGFLYGDRGVWRPGDSIFVSFILDDSQNPLPADQPVEFTLYDPLGKQMHREIAKTHVNHFYAFRYRSADNAFTGRWRLQARVGGAIFTMPVRIETIKPNRLKINVTPPSRVLRTWEVQPPVKFEVKWLLGTVGKNLKVNADVVLVNDSKYFKKFPGYVFTDPSKTVSSKTMTMLNKNTDDNGMVEMPFILPNSGVFPGMLKAIVNTKAFESGGDFSINQSVLPLSPFREYIGIQVPGARGDYGYIETGKKQEFNLMIAGDNGEKINTSNQTATVSVYKVDWRWWWDARKENFADYFGANSYIKVFSQSIPMVNGAGRFEMNVANKDWGRYFVQVSLGNGHTTGAIVIFDWPDGDRANLPGGATRLDFSADKAQYKPGEKIKLNFQGSTGGRALVSVENGAKQVAHYWVDTQVGDNIFEFAATKEMCPNAYIHITLLKPWKSAALDMPVRMYGVIPVEVEDAETVLNPRVSVPLKVQPGQNMNIVVSENNGKPMTFTLAVVDEGLLDITNFKTPDVHGAFYAREGLGVKTWDIYDYVAGAYGGRVEKMFAIGGDNSIMNRDGRKQNRFIPVVKYFGPYAIKSGEKKQLSFVMPEYAGSVKTMVVAASGKAYGSTDAVTLVQNPLMILGTLPRVAGPGEVISVPVTAFAMESGVKSATLKLSVTGNATIPDGNEQTVKFSGVGEQDCSFNIKLGNEPGMVQITVEAQGSGYRSVWTTPFEIRLPNVPVTKVKTVLVEPGKSMEQKLYWAGIPATRKVQLEVSSVPPLNIAHRVDELIRYPYGCCEQTVSSVFPQLYLSQLILLSNDEKQRIQQTITYTIERLKSYQTADGGFAYWPGSGTADLWCTSYVGHFMAEAANKGYPVPGDMKYRWRDFQSKQVNGWRRGTVAPESDDMIQAYRLYALARNDNSELPAMNYMRGLSGLSLRVKRMLASAYMASGHKDVAKTLINANTAVIEPINTDDKTFSSTLRERAVLLDVLISLGYKTQAMQIMNTISQTLNSNEWLNTQETAWGLMAASKYFAAGFQTSASLAYKYSVNGGGEIPVLQNNVFGSIDLNNKAVSSLKFTNTSGIPVFVNVVSSEVLNTNSPSVNSPYVTIDVLYFDKNNQSIDITKLRQGTDFKSIVRVYCKSDCPQPLRNMALTRLVPSGWEIVNSRLYAEDAGTVVQSSDYTDVRDDRISNFFDLRPGESRSFEALFNATYTGRFFMPDIVVESMYNNKITARKSGGWIEVIK